jgi:hypothetical protein
MAPQSDSSQLKSSKSRLEVGKEAQQKAEIAATQFAWVTEDEDLIHKVKSCKALILPDP